MDEKYCQKSTRHYDNSDKINEIIYQSEFMELINYTEFDWSLFGFRNIKKIIESHDLISFKYLINNTLNLEAVDKCRLIHIACRYGSVKMVKLLIDKNVNLETENDDNWRPIHIACRYGSVEMVKLLVDKHINLEAEISNGWRPIHFACCRKSVKMVKLLIDKNVNLEAEDDETGVQFILHVVTNQ